jgi:hypothetical protein
MQAPVVTPPTGGGASPAAATPTVMPAATPVVPGVAPVLPQGVQNPAALLAVQGGIGNGTRNNTPVQSRPAVVAPGVPVITPPSTGDAGLAERLVAH